MAISDRIKQERERLGLSQRELGDRVGVTRAAVSKWENGDTQNMQLKNLLTLCETLNVEVRHLVHGIGPQRPADKSIKSNEEADFIALYRMLPDLDKNELSDIAKIKLSRHLKQS